MATGCTAHTGALRSVLPPPFAAARISAALLRFSDVFTSKTPAGSPAESGNPQKDPARFKSLYEDVTTKIFDQLPDTTWVYPGHGNDTTLGAERPHLDEWRERGW